MNIANELQEIQDEVAYWELVRALLEEQDAMEQKIISLRLHINRLYARLHYAHNGRMPTDLPYPEPASDIVRDFSDFKAIQKFKLSDL